jgi:hypothetical protein
MAGVLDLQSSVNLNSRGGWQSFLAQCLSQVLQSPIKNDEHNLTTALRELMADSEVTDLLEAAEWYANLPSWPLYSNTLEPIGSP